MNDHILLLNVPTKNTPDYLTRLAREFRASQRFSQKPIQIVSTCFESGLPESLHALGVEHRAGQPWDHDALQAATAADANTIVVLAESDTDPGTDGRTLDIVDRLRGLGAKGTILAECVDDANRPRLKRFGADIVVRPMRGYPEMILRALAAPGSEAILENLFTSKGHECWRYDVTIAGWPWPDLVAMLVREDVGVPIAYRSREQELVLNPKPDAIVEADKLYVLVREGNARRDSDVEALLRARSG